LRFADFCTLAQPVGYALEAVLSGVKQAIEQAKSSGHPEWQNYRRIGRFGLGL